MIIHLEKVNSDMKGSQMKTILFTQPKDAIWIQLRQNLSIKHDADFLSKNRKAFKFYCKRMNIKLDIKTIAKLNKKEVDVILKGVDCATHTMFGWDKIELITKERFNELSKIMEDDNVSVTNLLEFSKYEFTSKFKDVVDAEKYWQGGMDKMVANRIHNFMLFKSGYVAQVNHLHQVQLINGFLSK